MAAFFVSKQAGQKINRPLAVIKAHPSGSLSCVCIVAPSVVAVASMPHASHAYLVVVSIIPIFPPQAKPVIIPFLNVRVFPTKDAVVRVPVMPALPSLLM